MATEATTSSRSPVWLLLISPAEAPSDQRHAGNKLSQPLGSTGAGPERKKESGGKKGEKEAPSLRLTLSGSINDQMEAICVTALTAVTGRKLAPPTYCIQMSRERPRKRGRMDGWSDGECVRLSGRLD